MQVEELAIVVSVLKDQVETIAAELDDMRESIRRLSTQGRNNVTSISKCREDLVALEVDLKNFQREVQQEKPQYSMSVSSYE